MEPEPTNPPPAPPAPSEPVHAAAADPAAPAGPRRPLRIAAVADLHVHKGHHGVYRPLMAEIGARADVLCMCGDLTNLGMAEEAENLAADLGGLRIPILAVLGNHDHHSGHAEQVRTILGKAGVVFLDDDETFELNGVGFAGVKGFGGGFSSYLLSAFGEEATKRFVAEVVNESLALENSLQRLSTERMVVLLHYAPIPGTVAGEPLEIYPFLGCTRLADTIDRFDVAAVFHGHAHRGVPTGKTAKGTPVYNCGLEVLRRVRQEHFLVVEV